MVQNSTIFAVIASVLLILFLGGGQLFSTVAIPFTWNGHTFEDLGQEPQTKPCGGGSISSDVSSDEFLTLSTFGHQNSVSRAVRTEITNFDEILIVYDGSQVISCNDRASYVVSDFSASVVGSSSGGIGQSKSIAGSDAKCEGKDGGLDSPKTYEPSVWKFKNNFDGTWSTMQYLGVGDTYIVKDTQPITGDKVYLELKAFSGNECYGTGSSGFASSSTNMKIYNIVVKENSFAVCKVDEYGIDTNNDGKITPEECTSTTSIILNAEEAFMESYEEKLQRLQEELEQKIKNLESQLATSTNKTEIQQEIADAKIILESVEERSPTVVATVEAKELFEESSTQPTSSSTSTLKIIIIILSTLGAVIFARWLKLI